MYSFTHLNYGNSTICITTFLAREWFLIIVSFIRAIKLATNFNEFIFHFFQLFAHDEGVLIVVALSFFYTILYFLR